MALSPLPFINHQQYFINTEKRISMLPNNTQTKYTQTAKGKFGNPGKKLTLGLHRGLTVTMSRSL